MMDTESYLHKIAALGIGRSGWKSWELFRDDKAWRGVALGAKARGFVNYDRYLNYRN